MAAKYPYVVLPYSGSHSLHQGLLYALESQSIHVQCKPSTHYQAPILQVITENMSTQPLVYGPDSELRRERLTLEVIFSFGLVKDPKLISLRTSRERQLISSQHLGDNAEKTLIEKEMQTDIINQLFRHLDSEHFSYAPST